MSRTPRSRIARAFLVTAATAAALLSAASGASALKTSGGPAVSPIAISNLSSGQFSKSGLVSSVSTAAFTVPANTLTLVHVMSCCDSSTPPSVTGPGGRFFLVVTHTRGEKRHWVFAAANDATPDSGTMSFGFSVPQSRVLWVVDAASHVDLGNAGANAIVQTAWQNSMANAAAGSIALAPFQNPTRNAAVGFALAGSGAATNIVPEPGTQETAEAETPGSNLIIDTFWRVGEDPSLSATFIDDATTTPEIESWLFLAVELRAEPPA
jgi:hypothetical protein